MNASVQEKTQLIEAGYTYAYSGNMHEWRSANGELVASEYKPNHARELAFEHMLAVKASELRLELAEKAAKERAAESPTPDSIEIPCVLEDKNARIAELEQQLAKAQTDLVAAQNIIVQAGQDFEALKQLTGYTYRCDYCHTPMNKARRVADTAGGDSQVCETCYPFADEPAQEVTLSEDEIEWLADDSKKLVGQAWQFDKLKTFSVGVNSKTWVLNPEFNTAANVAAIKAKRAELGLS